MQIYYVSQLTPAKYYMHPLAKMARNASYGDEFEMAFSKLILVLGLDNVRETYGLLLRDIARFEHKAALRKLKGEKLKTNMAEYMKFMADLLVKQEVAMTGGENISNYTTKTSEKLLSYIKSFGGGLMNAAFEAVLYGVGAATLTGVALTASSFFVSAPAFGLLTGWEVIQVASLTTGAYTSIAYVPAKLTEKAVEYLNGAASNIKDLHDKNKKYYKEEEMDEKMAKISNEFIICYKCTVIYFLLFYSYSHSHQHLQ